MRLMQVSVEHKKTGGKQRANRKPKKPRKYNITIHKPSQNSHEPN